MPRALNLHVRHYPGNAFVLYERLWMEILCRLSHNDHDGFDKKSNGEVENEPSGADPTPAAPVYLAHNWCIRGNCIIIIIEYAQTCGTDPYGDTGADQT